MPILIQFNIYDSCCTGQARNNVILETVTEFRSKTALKNYLAGLFGVKINAAFKRIFDENYNKAIKDHSLCENCGTIYAYGDPGEVQTVNLRKSSLDTFSEH